MNYPSLSHELREGSMNKLIVPAIIVATGMVVAAVDMLVVDLAAAVMPASTSRSLARMCQP